MARRLLKKTKDLFTTIPSVKLDPGLWTQIVEALGLSPQQSRVVELILQGMCDKQIAAELRLGVPTVRTHLGRIFQRINVGDRVELVLRVFAATQAAWPKRRTSS